MGNLKPGLHLRQRDGISCGPSVAVLAAAMLRPDYGTALREAGAASWFDAEQLRVHRSANMVWPRRLGMTPAGLAGVINEHSLVGYRWRLCRGLLGGRTEPLSDVMVALRSGLPVPMLVGGVIPRHWVLFVGVGAGERELRCYEPTSGAIRSVDVEAVRGARLTGLGYRRPFAFVVPGRPGPGTHCA
ncbi:hypothetical protein K0O62_27995 [Mycolicibacterium diernhoferi]|uniref:Peptidase C39-like domain-containing protein n=1 Tax=Mycolicibacterium diernhoferi TaxID=1801 RepID=A0A1Q4H4I0_9MYCO|nr:hypothetical protein BRW64_26995 [Mycolicibacterium diernhoferi]OPE53318.1 hypothetical protein BV510_16195 [Mycolicibacterium diernhoferi]PEG52158.1 hypothetical protein CRI78_22925 [Mycolicibacterium diernhoferi]QYL25832.1 hypothetical protein K0O62_27995 [Mycolicibacterium diernhoferi]